MIAELADLTYVNIAAIVTCMDEKVRQKIESHSAPSRKRLAMLKAFALTKASAGLHFMPIIPFLTDNAQNIDALYASAADCQVDYVLPGVLYLRGKTRGVFFNFIKEEFAALFEPLQALYKTGGAGQEYKNKLYPLVNAIKKKYSLSSSYCKPLKGKLKQAQARQYPLF